MTITPQGSKRCDFTGVASDGPGAPAGQDRDSLVRPACSPLSPTPRSCVSTSAETLPADYGGSGGSEAPVSSQ